MKSILITKKMDIYIKDEGYISIIPETSKAKEWLNDRGFKNNLLTMNLETFCDQPIWSPLSKVGVYRASCTRSQLVNILQWGKTSGLTIESEI